MFKPTRHRGGAFAGHTVMGNVSPWGCTMALTPEQQHGRGWGGARTAVHRGQWLFPQPSVLET